MKKKLLNLLAIFIVIFSIFTFTGCAVTLKGGPSKTDVVTGNGSMSVRKGDYLYFVNGYVSNNNLTGGDNNYGNARNGAIYRAKLQNGELMYDVTTNEDGDEVKTLKNVELLVPKVAGFEYTSLYIFDSTLYFTSPNTEKDKTGKIRFDLTDIFAVSIKGGKISKLANAVNIDSVNDFGFAKINNRVNQSSYCNSKGEEIYYEVKYYLPVQEKLEMISKIINQSVDDNGFYNPMRVKIFTALEVVYAYTNLSFTEKQKENPFKLYDLLTGTGIFKDIVNCIYEDDWKEIQETIITTIDNIYKFKNSALGIIEAIAVDYGNLDFDATNIQKSLSDPNNLALLRDVLAKLG